MNEHVRKLRIETAKITAWSPWGALPKNRSRRCRPVCKGDKPALPQKGRPAVWIGR